MTVIHHITHIANLSKIIRENGLWCENERARHGLDVINIAYTQLKSRRARTNVPICAQGVLADYVPFYFCNRSPMLYAIHQGNIDGYSDGQTPIIYLTSSVEEIGVTQCKWCFTDGHAVEAITRFYDKVEELNTTIDWDVIRDWRWNNHDDPDRKRRKQAEFLVHHFVPWKCIQSIDVRNPDVAKQVRVILQELNTQVQIRVQPKWYYD